VDEKEGNCDHQSQSCSDSATAVTQADGVFGSDNLILLLEALIRDPNQTRVAKALRISQPTVSASLAKLRKALKDELIVKSGATYRATPRLQSLGPATRFWLLFVDATRKAPAAPTLTDAEAIAMMRTQVAWTGKYTTAEQTAEGIKLTARVDAASSQAIFDTDRVYFVRVDGNRMMVKSPGVIVPMTGATSIVEFELVKAD